MKEGGKRQSRRNRDAPLNWKDNWPIIDWHFICGKRPLWTQLKLLQFRTCNTDILWVRIVVFMVCHHSLQPAFILVEAALFWYTFFFKRQTIIYSKAASSEMWHVQVLKLGALISAKMNWAACGGFSGGLIWVYDSMQRIGRRRLQKEEDALSKTWSRIHCRFPDEGGV